MELFDNWKRGTILVLYMIIISAIFFGIWAPLAIIQYFGITGITIFFVFGVILLIYSVIVATILASIGYWGNLD